MYIDNFANNKKTNPEEKKINDFYAKDKKEKPKLEEPKEMLIEEHSKDVLMHWKAPEHEIYEADKKWYMYIGLVLIAIIGYAIYKDSLIMAITFIMIGVVGYMQIGKEPRELDFMITYDGIIAGKELYSYDNLKSFWIFYEPGEMKVISLVNKSILLPRVHIPVHNEDPVKIRGFLLKHLPEEKQTPSVIDNLERILRI